MTHALQACHSPTAMPKPKRLFLLAWSISAERMKFTPTLTRSSRYAPTCQRSDIIRQVQLQPWTSRQQSNCSATSYQIFESRHDAIQYSPLPGTEEESRISTTKQKAQGTGGGFKLPCHLCRCGLSIGIASRCSHSPPLRWLPCCSNSTGTLWPASPAGHGKAASCRRTLQQRR